LFVLRVHRRLATKKVEEVSVLDGGHVAVAVVGGGLVEGRCWSAFFVFVFHFAEASRRLILF
jgi:hypothetical protein